MPQPLSLDPRVALGPRRVAIRRPADRAADLAAAELDAQGPPRGSSSSAPSPAFARLLTDSLARGGLSTHALAALLRHGGLRPPTSETPPGDRRALETLVARAAAQQGLDPALVHAVVQVESGFNPQAVSPAGAKGLMQLMDGTARALGVRDPFNAAENVAAGTRYLRQLLTQFGDERLALAAYNAGPGAVRRYGGVPPFAETQRYVATVLALRERYRGPR